MIEEKLLINTNYYNSNFSNKNIYYCYILTNGVLTYNGSTNNLIRRLRQHNGEITGGAKYTKNKGPWYYIFIMEGFKNKIDALKCEWKIKHPTGKRIRPKCYCGINGRIKSLNIVLNNHTLQDEYVVYINDDLSNLIDTQKLINKINILSINNIFII